MWVKYFTHNPEQKQNEKDEIYYVEEEKSKIEICENSSKDQGNKIPIFR